MALSSLFTKETTVEQLGFRGANLLSSQKSKGNYSQPSPYSDFQPWS